MMQYNSFKGVYEYDMHMITIITQFVYSNNLYWTCCSMIYIVVASINHYQYTYVMKKAQKYENAYHIEKNACFELMKATKYMQLVFQKYARVNTLYIRCL